jgi:hypothetical protein
MKTFTPLAFDPIQAHKEVLELRDLLAGNPVLEEHKDLVPFFRNRPHLSALCGLYDLQIHRFDRIAWEYELFGDFTCDLVVGDSETKGYCFIEFEDAGPRSLFVQQAQRAMRDWSPRFEHGYSQIIDWFYKLDDCKNSDDCEARFGKRTIDFTGVLVIGRQQYLQPGEALRLNWRRQHVIVHSKRIICVTYDELVSTLLIKLNNSVLAPGPQGKTGPSPKKPQSKKKT